MRVITSYFSGVYFCQDELAIKNLKKFNNKTVLQMSLDDRVTELERKFKNLQEYVIDLIEKNQTLAVVN